MTIIKKILLIFSLLTFCWFGSASAAEPINLGGTLGLTGKYAPMSEMVSLGLKLWTEKTNAKGGILGRPVELIIYDDTSSPTTAGKLYEKLILEDKVDLRTIQALLGHANMRTTIRYLHISADHIEGCPSPLDRL